MAGQRLGSRVRVVYTSDDIGKVYVIEIDQSYQIAGAGVGSAAPEIFDPNNPPAGSDVCPAPKRFEPRRVYAKASDGTRRSVICTSPDADLYATTLPKIINIDSESFTTTGRKGERQSF